MLIDGNKALKKSNISILLISFKSKVTKNIVTRTSHKQVTLDIINIDPDKSGLDKSSFKDSNILGCKDISINMVNVV